MEAPLSRVEAILQNILGADNVLVPPQSRVEAILLAILNNTEYIHPGDPSRVEEILLAIKDGGSYNKKALSRVEDILIHKLNDEEYTDYSEDDLSRVEKLLIQWIDLHPEVIKELTTSSFPISILANGLPLLDYRIDGNSVQSGTPTPDSPIEPEFCGDLVSIELDEPLRAVGNYKDTLDLATKTYTKRIVEYTFTGNEEIDSGHLSDGLFNYRGITNFLRTTYVHAVISDHFNSRSNVSGYGFVQDGEVSFYAGSVTSTNILYMRIASITSIADFKAYLAQQYSNNTPVKVWYVLAEPIVTTLSSIPDGLTGVIEGTVTQSDTPTPNNPIEPVFNGTLLPNGKYQVYTTYKIPISSAGQTKNIYLGQVPTTRRIEKIKLNDYDWEYVERPTYRGFFTTLRKELIEGVGGISNKFVVKESSGLNTPDGTIVIYESAINTQRLLLRCDSANGNPEQLLTILDGAVLYAVLATPEIGIVNEPLARIGDYADSVDFSQAGVEIPTLKKPNTTVIDAKTSLEPSSMYLKYTEPSDGPAPKTPVLGTKDREIYVTPNNEVYVLRR